MPEIQYLFVINPISGDNDKSTFYRFVEEEFISDDTAFELYKTTGVDDESELKKLVSDTKPKVVVAVGGDGTLLLVARVVKNKNIHIGLIPFGSANGMSKELKIPKIPDITLRIDPTERFRECWNIIQRGKVLQVDLLQINDTHYSIHLSDIGLNAKIVKRFEAEKIRGYFGYARLFFKELRQKKRIMYRVIADGKNYRGKAYMIVIANATKYGTGAVINPIGKLSDGIFEICMVKQIKLISLFRSLVSMFKKKLSPRKDLMRIISCKEARILLNEFETLQVDGEVVGEVNEVNVRILPDAINIIV